MSNPVLIPTDGSEYSENAAKVGFEMAEKIGVTVHVIAVGDPNLTHRSSIGAGPGKNEDEIAEIATEWAEAVAESARAAGLDVETVVKTGNPAAEIAAYAGEVDADMIVIGTAGRSGFERRILGSTTDKVVRTAPVPVVTVQPDGSVRGA